MLRISLLFSLCLLSPTIALAENQCEILSDHQVCWPSNDFVIFSGIQNGQALFALGEGYGRSANVGSSHVSIEDFRDEYLSNQVIHDGTIEAITDDINSPLTFTFSVVGSSQIDQPRKPNLGIPIIVSLLPVNGDIILVETFFPNPFQLQKNATWNDEKLSIHRKFTSYIQPLNN